MEIAGIDDKRQITAVFGGTMAGDLIYQGKTSKCLPSVDFPSDWRITFTENHWSNEKAMVDYLEEFLFPYIEKKRLEFKLDVKCPAVVIFDRFRGQCAENIFALLKVKQLFLQTAWTDSNHYVDVSVNKAVKEFLCSQFQEWYSEKICQQLQKGNDSALLIYE